MYVGLEAALCLLLAQSHVHLISTETQTENQVRMKPIFTIHVADYCIFLFSVPFRDHSGRGRRVRSASGGRRSVTPWFTVVWLDCLSVTSWDVVGTSS